MPIPPDLSQLEGRPLWTPERLMRRRKLAVMVATYCAKCRRYSGSAVLSDGEVYVHQPAREQHLQSSPGCLGSGVVAPLPRVN